MMGEVVGQGGSKPAGVLSRLTGMLRPQPSGAPEYLRVINLDKQEEVGNRIEVADTAARRNKGLLGRTRLDDGEGLWIVPCEAVHTFGMSFAIDLVYLDRQRRVLKVRNCVGPARISACLRAHSILELCPGTVSATRTQPGDRLEFQPVPAPSTEVAGS